MLARHSRSQLVCLAHSTRQPLPKTLSAHHLAMHEQYFTHAIGASPCPASTILGASVTDVFASETVPVSTAGATLWSDDDDASCIATLEDASVVAALPAASEPVRSSDAALSSLEEQAHTPRARMTAPRNRFKARRA